MAKHKCYPEMITVIDEYGCVVSVEFVPNKTGEFKVTIVHEETEES